MPILESSLYKDRASKIEACRNLLLGTRSSDITYENRMRVAAGLDQLVSRYSNYQLHRNRIAATLPDDRDSFITQQLKRFRRWNYLCCRGTCTCCYSDAPTELNEFNLITLTDVIEMIETDRAVADYSVNPMMGDHFVPFDIDGHNQ